MIEPKKNSKYNIHFQKVKKVKHCTCGLIFDFIDIGTVLNKDTDI